MNINELNGRTLKSDLNLPKEWTVTKSYHNRNKTKNSNFAYVIISPNNDRWKFRGEHDNNGEITEIGWWGEPGNWDIETYNDLLEKLNTIFQYP